MAPKLIECVNKINLFGLLPLNEIDAVCPLMEIGGECPNIHCHLCQSGFVDSLDRERRRVEKLLEKRRRLEDIYNSVI